MPTITVSKNGGTITVASTSEPSNPVITYGSLPSYAHRGTSTAGTENIITIDANSQYDREFELSVTATTRSDPAYQGTASDSSGWTVEQAGELGPAPNEKYVTINFNCTNNNGNARIPNVTIQVFGDDSGAGPQYYEAAGYKQDHSWPVTVTASVGDSEYAEIVVFVNDSVGGTYTYDYGLEEISYTGTVTVNSSDIDICDNSFSLDDVNNTFYLELKNTAYD